jgi:hypothetical protein
MIRATVLFRHFDDNTAWASMNRKPSIDSVVPWEHSFNGLRVRMTRGLSVRRVAVLIRKLQGGRGAPGNGQVRQ